MYTLSKDIFGAYLLAGISIIGLPFEVDDNWDALSQMTKGNKEPGSTFTENGIAKITYNSKYSGFADGAYANSALVLAHEMFHGLDLLTYFGNLSNPLMTHNKGGTALNSTYRYESSNLFGMQERLYLESRAVTYESLIRYSLGGNLLPMRFQYAPFVNKVAFKKMITEAVSGLTF